MYNTDKPKYKIGDILVLNISYSVSIYKVMNITNLHSKDYSPYYNLQGLGEIKQLDNGKNFYRTETKSYNPFVHYLDNTDSCRKATKAERLLYGKS